MGHGFVQQPMHKTPDQKAAITETIAAITKFTGRPPRGWESPGLTETDETLDLLAEDQYRRDRDAVLRHLRSSLRRGDGGRRRGGRPGGKDDKSPVTRDCHAGI